MYVMTLVHNGTDFPLLEKLNVALPLQEISTLAMYSGPAVGRDLETFATGVWAVRDLNFPAGYRIRIEIVCMSEAIARTDIRSRRTWMTVNNPSPQPS
jgi:hypothetical protein